MHTALVVPHIVVVAVLLRILVQPEPIALVGQHSQKLQLAAVVVPAEKGLVAWLLCRLNDP